MKANIVVDISPPVPYLAKFWLLIYAPKCWQSMKSMGDEVDFLHLQIKTKFFNKLIV